VRILAIRLARFGDIVLLLPAIRRLKIRFPDSHITFLTDSRWEPLAAMCPAIDEIITLNRIGIRDGSYPSALQEILRFTRNLRKRKFDVAIDFHGFRETNLIAWWSRAPKRFGLERTGQSYLRFCFTEPSVPEDKGIHVSEMFLRMAGRLDEGAASETLSTAPLVIPNQEIEWVGTKLPERPFFVFYVDAPVSERIWPLDRFVELAGIVTRQLGSPVVMVSGPGRAPQGVPAGVHLLLDLTIPQLAAVISSARMLISNDTGPMHLGPALGVPTVGIFSVGIPTHFRPGDSQDCFVQGNPIDRVGVEEVLTAVKKVWAATER
jgi:ADP-heptose:LPS heptosyltransferase